MWAASGQSWREKLGLLEHQRHLVAMAALESEARRVPRVASTDDGIDMEASRNRQQMDSEINASRRTAKSALETCLALSTAAATCT